MLIKLPNSVVGEKELSELIDQLNKKDLGAELLQTFYKVNSRLNSNFGDLSMVLEYLAGLSNNRNKIEVSFAQMADEGFILEFVGWARTKIKENILVSIKINPLLVGGFVLRTPQRIYDFSWSQKLQRNKKLLQQRIENASQ